VAAVQDDAADEGIDVVFLERLDELTHQLQRKGVEHVGPVQGDDGDGLLDAGENQVGRHSRISPFNSNNRRLENIAGGVNAYDSADAVLHSACAGRVEESMRIEHFAPIVTGLTLTAACHAANYHVGDAQPYPTIAAVPWQSLLPGDTVWIHWRAT